MPLVSTKLRGAGADAGARSNRGIVAGLIALMVFMFGFGYALVPLYDTFCIAFGLNGKTGVTDDRTAAAQGVDQSRWITIQFTSHTASGLPWDFRPAQRSIKVHPGEVMDALYVATNKTADSLVGRATYSVAPPTAAVHFKKTECFCFTNQVLEGGEMKEMPVRFVVERELPADIRTITLSYSFFNAEKYSDRQDASTVTAVDRVLKPNNG